MTCNRSPPSTEARSTLSIREQERVQNVSSPRLERISRRVARDIDGRLAYYAEHRREIDLRLEELAREWPIERLVEANLSFASILGLVLGAARNRLWLLLPFGIPSAAGVHELIAPFLLLRRLGVRTEREILYERAALKALRGDFEELAKGASREVELDAVS